MTGDEIEAELERALDHYTKLLRELAEAESEAERVELTEYVMRKDEGGAVEDCRQRAKFAALEPRRLARLLVAREKSGRAYIDKLTTQLMRRMGQEKREAKIV
jgi:hypothetical protein